MGYGITPGMVESSVDILEIIKANMEKGEPTIFEIKDLSSISREQYRLRRLLKATEILLSEGGGRYAGMGRLVVVRVRAEESKIIVEPKVGSAVTGVGSISIKPRRVNEHDIISSMGQRKGTLTMLEFYPTDVFVEGDFARELERMKWRLHLTTREELEGGKLKYAAERMEEQRSGFGMIQ